MLSGEYVAVRKLVRSLVQGEQAKSVADKLISKCGVPINLRTEIMR